MALVRGIDVSGHQGTIDWDAVKADGIRFAVIKATQELFVDSKFQRNQIEARRTMERVGYYHFFKHRLDPEAQARHFTKIVGPLRSSEFLVLDSEERDVSPDVAIPNLRAFLLEVERLSGKRPWIYTSPSLAKLLQLGHAFPRHPLWIAHWGTSQPQIPAGWGTWTIWQTSASGRVAGIKGDVDLNVAESGFLGLGAVGVIVIGGLFWWIFLRKRRG